MSQKKFIMEMCVQYVPEILIHGHEAYPIATVVHWKEMQQEH